ncbi:MAG: hypothetical protein HRT56_04830 [Coraliomargarita sp.]|nr:hypothetical protein [Coraliomargarita sp.]
MWKICTSISFIGLVAVGSLSAQGSFGPTQQMAPQGPAAPQSAQGGFSAPANSSLESNTFLTMADRVFNPDSDSMDFENGNFVWKGKQFSLVNQRAFRARLERFLLASPNEDDERYSQLMNDIINELAVNTDNSDDSIIETWELLFRASDFESDGGNSSIVANQVFNAWRIRKESRGVSLSQRELQDLRKYQQEVVANRTQMLEYIREKKQRESIATTTGKQGRANEKTSSKSAATSEMAFRIKDLAETEARILALEGQAAATGIQAKLQFQSQIVAFMQQRRFQHALILCGFYNLLFKGSQQQLEVGKEDLKSFFPNSDLSFTVDTLSFIAREAINDIEKGVSAVNTAYAEDRQMIALERLQETFFLGEYVPELNLIPTEQRRALLDLYRMMIEAGELAETKDYDGVEEIAQKIAELANDFPHSRVLASMETAKSMSDMAVFAASQYRNLGDIDKAREELQTAITIWPSNPAIREFQSETTRLATAGSQGIQVFDDLFKRNDKRGIYERRMELGFALADDPMRKPKLMEVVEEVARIELLVKQSDEFLKQGEAFAAWELLDEAAKVDSDDAALNKARAELAPRVATFVSNLDFAERQSNEGRAAGSLAAYLIAQDIYPASRICREGIEREASKLMAQMKADAVVVEAE